MIPKHFAALSGLKAVSTAHHVGTKKVFLTGSESDTSLTQFAYGELAAGEKVEEHRHPTMEEFFYFISGSGKFVIEGDEYNLEEGVFIHVPANFPHRLINSGKEALQFVYFGIAL